MKRHVLVLGMVAISAAVVVTVVRLGPRPRTRGEPEGPFTPSQQPGAVIAAAGYRLSGPYTHENLSVFLVHGPETLEGKSFLTLQDGLEQVGQHPTAFGEHNRAVPAHHDRHWPLELFPEHAAGTSVFFADYDVLVLDLSRRAAGYGRRMAGVLLEPPPLPMRLDARVM